MFQQRVKTEFDYTALQSLQLREFYDGNRLTLDHKNKRLEIARGASEVEREWLYHELEVYYRLK